MRVVGPGTLRLEGSRSGLPAAEIEIRQPDRVVGRFTAEPEQGSHEFHIDAGSPARFGIFTASRTLNKSVRLRRVEIEPSERFSLQPEPAILLRTALGAALLTAVLASRIGAAWGRSLPAF